MKRGLICVVLVFVLFSFFPFSVYADFSALALNIGNAGFYDYLKDRLVKQLDEDPNNDNPEWQNEWNRVMRDELFLKWEKDPAKK